MIGATAIRSAHFVFAVAAQDVELREGLSRFRTRLVLACEGCRIEASGVLGDQEFPGLARELRDLLSGARTAASLVAEDGSFRLFVERRAHDELAVCVWLRRDPVSGLYSATESVTSSDEVAAVADSARAFPYG